MKKVLNASLKIKIVGLSLVTLGFTAAGAFYAFEMIKKDYFATLLSEFQDFTELAAGNVSDQYVSHYRSIQMLAMNDAVESMSRLQMTDDLNAFVKMEGAKLVLVVDAKGKLVAANTVDADGATPELKPLIAKNFSEEPWFKAVMANELKNDDAHGLSGAYAENYAVDSAQSEAFGGTRYGTGFSAPIKDKQGAIIGVLSLRMDGRWFEKPILDVAKIMRQKGFVHSDIELFNSHGETVLKHNVFDDQGKIVVDPAVFMKPGGLEQLGETTGDRAVGKAKMHDTNLIQWTVGIVGRTDEIMANANGIFRQIQLILGVILFFSITAATWFSIFVSKRIEAQVSALNENSAQVSDAAKGMAAQSNRLSEGSTEQAAALQEMMAAVDEIGAMVEKNAEAARSSREVSNKSREASNHGRDIVESMTKAIHDVSASNDEIAAQMSQSNAQLSEITQLISDIGSKTKVINEIVFQTKLLSFNASVEAARAGEAGKGFAVVAEEVGNLATMSGKAAGEITTLLDESVRKVESIVSATKARVDQLMDGSRAKVDVSLKTTEECRAALDDILQNVTRVDGLVSEIAVASEEQATGIREISKAVSQMEQVTSVNANIAQESSVSSQGLRSQSTQLDTVVKDLVALLKGETDGVVRRVSQEAPTSVPKTALKPVVAEKTAKVEKKAEKKIEKKADKKKASSVEGAAKKAAPPPEQATAKVIPLPIRKEKPAPAAHVESAPLMKASGFGDIPSADDPGFSEEG